MTTPTIIEQVTGPKRRMVLKGRAKPHVEWGGGLEFGVEMRTKKTELTASPVANLQVLGASWPNTVITGGFHDKFLLVSGNDAEGVDLVRFPQLSAGAGVQAAVSSGSVFSSGGVFSGVQPAQLARVVAAALELMVLEGQRIRFQWDSIVRYGVIKRFAPRYMRIEDIFYEIEFQWSGKTENSPVQRRQTYNAMTTAVGLQTILDALIIVTDRIANLRQPNAFVARVTSTVLTIADLVLGVINALRSIVSISTAPTDLISTISGSLAQIRDAALGLQRDLLSIRSARGEAALYGDAAAVAIATLIQQELREQLAEMAAYAAEQQRLLALFQSREIVETRFADSFTSLRDVARETYGDPTRWVEISNFNSFYSDTVPAGTLIRVPAVG